MATENTGKFKKGNQAAKKKPRASYKAYHGNDTRIPAVPIEDHRKKFKDFIPFGSDNLFPNALASLARKSPVHRALINSKTFYITGESFITENDRLNKFLDESNEQEDFRAVHNKLVRDKLQGGNAYWQLHWTDKAGLVKSFHIDYTKCRLSKEGDSILIHPNWRLYHNTKKDTVTIPLFPNFIKKNGVKVSMVHIKEYEPEFTYYGIPSSVASLDSAGIAYKTNKWNLSRLDNDFKTSGILIIDADFSDEDAAEFDKDFDNEFIGEGKQGKVLKVTKNVGEGREGTKFVPVSQMSEGDWIKLHELSTDELVIAHNWYRSISGLAQEGKLGSTQEIRNEYTLALNTVTTSEQKSLLRVYNRVFEAFNMDDPELAIFNKPIIDLKDVDTDGVIEIIKAVKNNEIDKEAAIRLMGISYGITKEDSTILLQ